MIVFASAFFLGLATGWILRALAAAWAEGEDTPEAPGEVFESPWPRIPRTDAQGRVLVEFLPPEEGA